MAMKKRIKVKVKGEKKGRWWGWSTMGWVVKKQSTMVES
jgi:hypothetical protein